MSDPSDLHRRHADELAELQAELDRTVCALERAMAESTRLRQEVRLLREEADAPAGGGEAP